MKGYFKINRYFICGLTEFSVRVGWEFFSKSIYGHMRFRVKRTRRMLQMVARLVLCNAGLTMVCAISGFCISSFETQSRKMILPKLIEYI